MLTKSSQVRLKSWNQLTSGYLLRPAAHRVVERRDDDTFFARDGVKDTIDGGTGTDRAPRDSIDVRTNIKQTIP